MMKPYIDSLLPDPILDIFGLMGPEGSGVVGFVTSRVQLALFIAIGVLVLVAVVYALVAAFKYIKSQGDPGKIEEAQKAIKAIFMGLAALMIAIIGIVLIFVFFGANMPKTDLIQTCISSPDSQGCTECKQNLNSTRCQYCEDAYKMKANGSIGDVRFAPTIMLGTQSVNGYSCVGPLD